MRETRLAAWLTVSVTVGAVLFTSATTTADEVAIRKIIQEEVAAWNSGDATAYSQHFAPEGSFTNIYGMVFNGHDAFEKRHGETFTTFFKGSTRVEMVRRIRFVTADVAIVDVNTEVRGLANMPAGVTVGRDGVLRTRLLQVFVKPGPPLWGGCASQKLREARRRARYFCSYDLATMWFDS